MRARLLRGLQAEEALATRATGGLLGDPVTPLPFRISQAFVPQIKSTLTKIGEAKRIPSSPCQTPYPRITLCTYFGTEHKAESGAAV